MHLLRFSFSPILSMLCQSNSSGEICKSHVETSLDSYVRCSENICGDIAAVG